MSQVPTLLCKEKPSEIADTFRKLKRQNLFCLEGEWVCYQRASGAYVGLTDKTVRAEVYQFLDKAEKIIMKENPDDPKKPIRDSGPFNPKKSDVNEVMEALSLKCHLPIDRFTPPCWLVGRSDKTERADPRDIIVCKNGLLNIKTRKLSDHTPLFFTRTALPIAYDVDAPKPTRFLRFLGEIMMDRTALIKLIQEMFGYLLSSDTEQEVVFYLLGQSRGGKGTLQKVLLALLGSTNVATPTIRSFANQYWAWPLMSKTLAMITDMAVSDREATKLAANHINMVSGRDPVDVERKFLDPITAFTLAIRILMAGNMLPDFGDHAVALANRLLVIPFDVSFKGKEDRSLARMMIRDELPGILNWSLAGLASLQHEGHFLEPPESKAIKDELLRTANPVRTFLDGRCELLPDKVVAKATLFNAYKTWCESNAMRPLEHKNFAARLFEIVPHSGDQKRYRPLINGVQVDCYVGIKLKHGAGPMPPADSFDFADSMRKGIDLGCTVDDAYAATLAEASRQTVH